VLDVSRFALLGRVRRSAHDRIELLGDQRTGCAGRVELVSGERSAIEAGLLDEIGFAIVVGDQCDALAERHRRCTIHTRTLAMYASGARRRRTCEEMSREIPANAAPAATSSQKWLPVAITT
jgi:hypothetical protein